MIGFSFKKVADGTKTNTHPIFFIEYLTQNELFHAKSHVTKHEFWGLSILKFQHLMLSNLTWNETRNDTSLKKSGEYLNEILFNWP